MATKLQIRHLRIRTVGGWQDPYDFNHPVVAVIGPVDTGKSSMLDCIAFGLGAELEDFRGAVDKHLREVEVGIQVRTGAYILRRTRKTQSRVDIFDATGTMEARLPTRSRGDQPSISHWLLEQMGLDDLLASVRLPDSRSLDFPTGLLPYLYLAQDDIDRHIIRPARDDVSRLAVLRLLLNLTSPEAERLLGEIRDADNEIARLTRQSRVIGEFLAGSPAGGREALNHEIAELRQDLVGAQRDLYRLREAGAKNSAFADPLRQRVQDARQAVGTAEDVLDEASRKLNANHAQEAAVMEALHRLNLLHERSPDDRSTLHFVMPECPACELDISERPVPPGHCYLCHQPLPGSVHIAQRHRLTQDLEKILAARSDLDRRLAGARETANEARRRLGILKKQLDSETSDELAPLIDDIALATARIREIETKIGTLRRLEEQHERLDEQSGHIKGLQDAQTIRRGKLDADFTLEPEEHVLAQLNATFQNIIKGIGLPHATGRARLDPANLLPLVDEQTFSQRGGGARVAVSVAYSLALLTYTLEREHSQLPSLLMIDSPQKNFGANKDDKALSHRVYEQFLNNMEERGKIAAGRFQRPFQLIIVDNDIPADIRKRVKIISFSRESGFIQGLSDPHADPSGYEQLQLDEKF